VHEDALPRLKAAVLEQSLPRGEARDRQARAPRVKHSSAVLDEMVEQESAVLAGACFWGMQDLIRKLPSVISTRHDPPMSAFS
jgi:hypothetical protein